MIIIQKKKKPKNLRIDIPLNQNTVPLSPEKENSNEGEEEEEKKMNNKDDGNILPNYGISPFEKSPNTPTPFKMTPTLNNWNNENFNN